jgi:SAM-dependent methyltransferase
MDKQTQKKLLELVKKNYDEIAEDFNETRQKVIWPELLKISEKVEKGSKILDAGCGNGRLLQAFRFKPICYIGLDYNKKFIDYAAKSWALPCGKFVFGDILDIGKNKEVEDDFDRIFCIAVLHNIPGHDLRVKALRQLGSKVKKEGEIVVSVWNFWNKWKYLKHIIKHTALKIIGMDKMDFGDIIFDWKGKKKSSRYYHAFTSSGLRKIAEDSGLTIKKLYRDKYNYYLFLKRPED